MLMIPKSLTFLSKSNVRSQPLQPVIAEWKTEQEIKVNAWKATAISRLEKLILCFDVYSIFPMQACPQKAFSRLVPIHTMLLPNFQ